MIRNWFAAAAAGTIAQSVAGGAAHARDALVLAQAGGVKVSQTGGKTYAVEILVVLVMLGLALFVVCKTSRRV